MAKRALPFAVLAVLLAAISASLALSPVGSDCPGGGDVIGMAVDGVLREAVAAGAFSGSVLVARHGEVIYAAGFGLADRERQVPVTPATRFYVGALTRSFTAAAILLLEQDGKLSRHDSVCRYLPQCREAWQSTTIDDLLRTRDTEKAVSGAEARLSPDAQSRANLSQA